MAPDPHTTGAPFVPPGYTRPPGRDAPIFPAKSNQKRVQRMLEQVAGEVTALEPRVLKKLLPVFMEARRELRAALTSWLKGVDGAERFTAQQYRRALVSLEGAIKTMAKLDPAMRHALEEGNVLAAHLAAGHLEFELARFADVFRDTIRPIQIDAAALMVSGDHTLIPRFRTSAARYGRRITEDIRAQLGVGVARGETYTQMTNRLRRLGGPRGLVALRGVKGEPGAIVEEITEGLFKRYRHWGERIVRTEMQQAYNVHANNGIDELNREARDPGDPEFMRRWDASADKRLCDVCRTLDRQVVGADEKFHSELGEHDHPPAHPNCRCIVSPWLKRWGTQKRAEEAEPIYATGKAPTAKLKAKPEAPPKPKPKPKPKRKKPEAQAELAKQRAKRVDLENKLAEARRRVDDPGNVAGIEAKRKAWSDYMLAHPEEFPSASPAIEAGHKKLLAFDKEIEAARLVKPKKRDMDRAYRLRKELEATRERIVELRSAPGVDPLVEVAEAMSKGDHMGAAEALEHEFKLTGYQKGRKIRAVEIRKLPDAYAQMGWDGLMEVTPECMSGAEKFAQAMIKAPAKTEKLIASYERVAERIAKPHKRWVDSMKKAYRLEGEMAELQRQNSELLRQLVAAEDAASGAGSIRARKKFESAAVKIEGKMARVKAKIAKLKPKMDTARAGERAAYAEREVAAKAARDHAGFELSQNAHNMKTIAHEVFHTFSPIERMQYRGAGCAIEEATTEIMAQKFMRRFGMPATWGPRVKSYEGIIDALLDGVVDAYKVDRKRAWTILENAADAFKRLPADSLKGPTEVVSKFIDMFPNSDSPGVVNKLALAIDEGVKFAPYK